MLCPDGAWRKVSESLGLVVLLAELLQNQQGCAQLGSRAQLLPGLAPGVLPVLALLAPAQLCNAAVPRALAKCAVS